ncbi:phage tail protein [Pseudomonas fildesensis]|uniref:phage tail protein n=1 Tax=Pseudomonas fildesensis TaxID=1674920 RepID=UPI00387B01C5
MTLNSNAVVGTGTAFVANSRVGDAFLGPDGGWYEITNIASNTALSITPNYRGATNAAGVYALTPVQGYTKDLADQARAMIQQWGATLAGLGTVSIENIVPVAKGGTGGNSQAGARTGLGLGAAAVAAIVGTASQANGVPTGAIIERGGNANGEYIKYADGTMICWGASPIYFTTPNVAGAIYIASTTASFTFPAVFSTFPRVTDASLFDHPGNGAAGAARGWGVPFAGTKTSCQIALYGHAANSAIWPGYSAIGRWF